MNNVLIIGATSAIAEATARLFAQRGDRLYLMARDRERLAIIADDLKIRGAFSVQYSVFDFTDLDEHKFQIENAIEALGKIDIALIAHGTYPDQSECQNNFSSVHSVFNDNTISTLSILTLLANHFEKWQSGTIAVVTSVAGDRGRKSNYAYGASKAAVSVFMQGLRNRLHTYGVHVLTLKPGYVDTPMTANYRKNLLWAKPESIANGILSAIRHRRDVVYLPCFWRFIMLIIKLTPEFLFKRTNL